jgi:23S rRNA (adenine2030-N6)-methyltransferase
MLSYQHRYHAGNFADVHKHLVLTLALQGLARKPAPFSMIDTHAGEGLYDLASKEAARHQEFRDGIEKVLAVPDPPPAIRPYLDQVRAANPAGGLCFYPGSPDLALAFCRSDDDVVLVEMHPQALSELENRYARERRVHIHRRDGFEALAALVPPRTRRGVALIDPAYEQKSDYEAVVRAIERAHARWSTGLYLVWYPLLPAGRHDALFAGLKATGIRKIMRSEWLHRPPAEDRGLYGSGILAINPLWKMDEAIREAGAWMEQIEFGTGPATLGWLVPE